MAKGDPTVTEQLLAGTRDLIRAEGTTDLSVRRLATASGRSTMCVYTAFGTRSKLLEAAHAQAVEEWVAQLRGPGGCAEIASRYVDFATREAGLFTFVLDPAVVRQQIRAQVIRRVLDVWRQCPAGPDCAWPAWSLTHGHVTGTAILGEPDGPLAPALAALCAAA